MVNKLNAPEIRFIGYVDPWEQRKLGEVCSFSKGFGYSKGDIKDSGTPLILYGRLYTRYETSISKVDTFAEPIPGSIYSSGNEVIMPSSGETAEDIAIASSVRSPGILLGGGLNVAIPKKGLDPDFLALGITSGPTHKYLAKCAQGKSIVHLYNADVANAAFTYPSIKEQQAISTTILNFDSLITLHQRKCNNLRLVKKSMLQKMFPRDGATVPEIRFAGFTGSWEQRKLGEMVDVHSGQDYKHLSKGDIPVYGTGGYMLSVDKALSYSRDAIGIGRKGTIDSPYLLHAPFWTVDTLFYAIPKANYDLNFVYSIFEKINWKKKDESTGVPSLSKTTIKTVDIIAPNSDEQRQIGSFFRNLDSLITLHQRKLDLFIKVKQSMLQKMFV